MGQLLLVEAYAAAFAAHGLTVGQVLLTADDLHRRGHYRNAQRTMERLLTLGVVPIVNENDTVATHEIRFGDNDRLAALVAHLVHADALVLLSDVDGLYDDDPRLPGSTRIDTVASSSDLTACGWPAAAVPCRPAGSPPSWRPPVSPRRRASRSMLAAAASNVAPRSPASGRHGVPVRG